MVSIDKETKTRDRLCVSSELYIYGSFFGKCCVGYETKGILVVDVNTVLPMTVESALMGTVDARPSPQTLVL